MESHFSPEHKQKLAKVFLKLVDFMHKHGIEQIVGAGPSATPYVRAVARAYQNRHGKTVKVVNLGEVGGTNS